MDMEVLSPEEAHLECDFTLGDPKASLHWYKDNKELTSNKKYDTLYQDEIATLVIRKTEVTDRGWYRCEAVNKIGRVETECTVVVQGKELCVVCVLLKYTQNLFDTFYICKS